ncbi:type VII secretion integral membrane protein EccD [Actinoplanes oblitus]|uniref:Type VII secretion integral membrane protein EccD n=1 Tax=Actinoplanes oblitus TaxID=3040509 RepID=A0ABY8WGR3_9ACTN|nr:type VII secretion integral membrane protein EccD [Actinoplanes oblitus]WIM96256.1 type VII secretion integral membrane protein EccD [Actinoplanes oblitus]
METGLARVTISTPRRRVDVALPEHVPLAELLPEVLRHAGEDLADAGERHGGWVLRRAAGDALEVGRGLHQQGVRDGEVLHLRPAHDDWPELEYDDVAEAVAEGARRRGGTWSPAATRATALATAGVALTAGLIVLCRAGAGGTGLALAVLLVLAATAASRAFGAAPAAVLLGGFALPYAFAGGALLAGLADPGGALLAGSVALLLAAVAGAAGPATGTRVWTAGAAAGTLGAAAVFTGPAVLLAALVCGVSLLPGLAIHLGRLPRPPAGPPEGPALEAVRHRPDRAEVLAALDRTDDLLTGLLLGHAVLVAGAAVALARLDTPAARVLLGAAALALLLRARLFRARRHRLPLLAGGLAAVLALGAELLGAAGAGVLPAAAAGCVLAALAAVAWPAGPPAPALARLADVLDVLATVAVIPVACAVTGLYAAVSGISF